MERRALTHDESNRLIEPLEEHFFERSLFGQPTELVDAGVITMGLDHVGEVDDHIERGHIFIGDGMTRDCLNDLGIVDAVIGLTHDGADGSVQQKRDGVFDVGDGDGAFSGLDGQLIVLELAGAIVEETGDVSFVDVDAEAFSELDGGIGDADRMSEAIFI